MERHFLVLCLITIVLLSDSSFASGWILHGTVIDGGTCGALAQVNITSSYRSSNISDANGRYLLYLGFGAWNITAQRAGYDEVAFNTPYLTMGAFDYNFSMLKPGEAPYNCSNPGYPKKEGNIINITTTSIPTTTIQQSSTSLLGGLNARMIPLFVVLISIVVTVAVYYLVIVRRKET